MLLNGATTTTTTTAPTTTTTTTSMSATKVKSSFFAIGRILIDLYRKRNFIIDKQFKGTVYCTELYLYLSMYALIYQSSEHLLEGF